MATKEYNYECSECGSKQTVISNGEKPETQFCGACGAPMNFVSEVSPFEEKEGINVKFELEDKSLKFNLTEKPIIENKSIAETFLIPVEEVAEFPELGKAKLPENIKLLSKNPECNLVDCHCVNYCGKDVCLRLLHEKPKEGYKAIFELHKCVLEGKRVEETESEGFEVHT